MLVRLADVFVHNSLHTVPEDWRLAFEPHEVSCFAQVDLGVYVKLAEATSVGCRLAAVVYDGRNDSGNCS